MDIRQRRQRSRLWVDWAQLIIGLFVPLTIIGYTIIQNNTELSIAKENRLQDLKIADERHEQDMILSNDQQEEATLVNYFDSLAKFLEENENLINKRNIVRFKTLTALAQLKSKRKSFLIRSLIENKLIRMNKGQNSILDLSLADLTNLDLTNNMIVNNELICLNLIQTTLTNSSFKSMKLHASIFTQSLLDNSDFSFTQADLRPCGDGNLFGVHFKETFLDNSNFDDAKYIKSVFSGSSLNDAKMRRFKCTDCKLNNVNMNSTDLSEAIFLSDSNRISSFQSVKMFSTILYRTTFIHVDFALSTLTMVNFTQTIFNNSYFSVASLEKNFFFQTIIFNSSFYRAFLIGSKWSKAKISYTNFFETDMTSVQFVDSQCHFCLFNGTILTDANLTNSSFDGSDFRQAIINVEQLVVARSLRNVILPNGTLIQSIKN